MIILSILQTAQETTITDRFTEGLLMGLILGGFGTFLFLILIVGPLAIRGLGMLLQDVQVTAFQQADTLRQPPTPSNDEQVKLLLHVIEDEEKFVHRLVVGVILGLLVTTLITVITLGIVRFGRHRNRKG